MLMSLLVVAFILACGAVVWRWAVAVPGTWGVPQEDNS